MKKILIASGTSDNKKKFAKETIEKNLKDRGIVDVEVLAENVYTLNIESIKPDLVVLIGPNTMKVNVPIVSGIAFITKISSQIDSTCEEIVKKLGIT
jgi:PTS system galactitol-specific IIB component